MARPLRIEYPGAYYHVMSQENEARMVAIYLDLLNWAVTSMKKSAKRLD